MFRIVDSRRRFRRDLATQLHRVARSRRRCAGGRLGGAPGRRPLRRALQAVGRGQGRRPRRPGACRAGRPTCGWPRTASPTAIYEKLTGDKGVFSTRIAYVTAGGQPLHAARHRRRRRGRPGRAQQHASRSSRRPGRPTAESLAYVSFESGKAVVWAQDVATGERRAIANFRGSNSAPAWSPDGAHAGRHAVARRRLADLPDRTATAATCAASRKATPSTPSRCSRPTASRSTSSATAAAARRSTAWPRRRRQPRARDLQRQLQHQPRDQPRRAHAWPTSTATATSSGSRRSTLAAARCAPSATPSTTSPSFAPNGKLIIYATRAQGRDVLMTTTLDGTHPHAAAVVGRGCARADLGTFRPVNHGPTTLQGGSP